MEDSSLLNISSSYIIKQTFSFIDYNRFISLIKYNKNYQNILEFNLKKNVHYNKKIEKKEEVSIGSDEPLNHSFVIYIFVRYYLYFIIHYILNLVITIKLNNASKSNEFFWSLIDGLIIKKLSVLMCVLSFHVLCHVSFHTTRDYTITKSIYLLLLDLILIFHVSYEILLIYKIKTIYSFALNGKWIIIFDAIYLIANIYFIYFSIQAGKEYNKCKEYSRYSYYNYLLLFKGINIKEFELPKDFNSIENKRKYLEFEANYFEIEYSNDNIDLINSINIFRKTKNLNELIVDYKIPYFIIKGSTEIILYSSNIIKLSDIK